ncbi:MAG TPA: MBL fold metallo-hydrolase [Jatrophihabitantaceae bacterium]|jgi:L-ascorbate metabolism protein UlaG (beta-lactamase superfamily)
MSTLTKFSHSCVRFDDGDRSLVIDPGVFSEVDAALDGAGGVLITHEHPDHINVDAVRAAAKADPRLRIWAPPNLAAALELGDQAVAVTSGETFEAAGFGIEVFGGQHAVLHPSVPVIQNNCYLVDDAVYHPGDSFIVPTKPVQLLLLPLHAPWSKTAEVIDFAVSMRAPRAIQIHDGMLNEVGTGFVEGHVKRIAGEHGVEYSHADPRSSLGI